MKLAFIGGGNMASALIGGIVGQGWAPSDIRVADISADARTRLQTRFGIEAVDMPTEAATGADCIVFAVKPQQMPTIAKTLAAAARDALVVTIAAGIRTSDLSRWLGGHERLVRVMPNTPALVGAGISALFALPAVSADERAALDRLFSAVGQVLWLDRESLMDGVTAVSGSGPAYAFYLIEAMEAGARELGFDAAAARQLAIGTVLGAAQLALGSDDPAEVLRAKVTSKGGTTEAAIRTLDAADVKAHLLAAIRAAEAKSRELGAALGAD